MSKLQALLEKQKELALMIEKAKEDEKAKAKADYVSLYAKLKLDRFTTEQIQKVLSSLDSNKGPQTQKTKTQSPDVEAIKTEEMKG
jgi:hypothetical protein